MITLWKTLVSKGGTLARIRGTFDQSWIRFLWEALIFICFLYTFCKHKQVFPLEKKHHPNPTKYQAFLFGWRVFLTFQGCVSLRIFQSSLVMKRILTSSQFTYFQMEILPFSCQGCKSSNPPNYQKLTIADDSFLHANDVGTVYLYWSLVDWNH